MDIISFNEASTANSRIESFIENPDSTSGIVTVPKTIASGETITIPAGRIAMLPNVQVDGVLNIEGEVFVPSGATFGDLESQIALKADIADTFGTSILQVYNDTATKAFGVTYTNNTGRPKHIKVIQGLTTSTITLSIDGVICDTDSISTGDYSAYTSVSGIVPNGKSYIVNISGASGGASGGVYRWIESY